MANTYFLDGVRIDGSSGVAKAIITAIAVDDMTGRTMYIEDSVMSPPPAVQARIDNIMQDALTYARAKYPGIVISLRPAAP